MCDECGTMSAGHDGIAGLVETMMIGDSLRPGRNDVRVVEGAANG